MEQKLNTYTIARTIKAEELASLLEDYVNGRSSRDGLVIGRKLIETHPTLQAEAVGLCLNILYAMADRQYTDARNATAIATCKKIKAMMDDGEFSRGQYI